MVGRMQQEATLDVESVEVVYVYKLMRVCLNQRKRRKESRGYHSAPSFSNHFAI